jgi:N-acetyl sugar amidotransferase
MRVEQRQTCQKLVLDTTDPELKFDRDGICHPYHDFQENVKPRWEASLNSSKEIETAVAIMKAAGRGKDYDCLMGLSGGADSSYMLHKMVTEFGIRPLVFHVDAGWNSEIAVHNINCMVDKLGLDLFTEVINWEEVKEFQLAMFKSGLPNIDLPQDIAFIGVLFQFAAKHNIKYILNGGNISTECVSYPLQYFYYADMSLVKDILSKFSTRSLSTYPFTSILYRKFYMPFVKGIKMIKPLNMMSYFKTDAMAELAEIYGWKPYSQKHFESRFTRFFEGYWLPTRFDYDVRRVQFSSMILTGQMSRDQALEKLEQTPYDESLIREDFDYIAKKLDISSEELKTYHAMQKKYYWDYQNNASLMKFGEKVLARVANTKRGGAY